MSILSNISRRKSVNSQNPTDSQEAQNKPAQQTSLLDILGPDDPLVREMQQLLDETKRLNSEIKGTPLEETPLPQPLQEPVSEDNRHLPLEEIPQPETSQSPTTGEQNRHSSEVHSEAAGQSEVSEPLDSEDLNELARLREENSQLKSRLEEVEQILAATTNQTEEMWTEQLKEYESLLEEKSEVIRHLHQEIQQLREGGEKEGQAAKPVGNDQTAMHQELLALKEQLETDRRHLEEDRRMLEEDEAALMEQARQNELALSKDRVELARQKSELQRLYQDFQREIEKITRDGNLRERLIQVKQQRDVNGQSRPAPRAAVPTQAALNNPANDSEPRPGSSGLLKRIFG